MMDDTYTVLKNKIRNENNLEIIARFCDIMCRNDIFTTMELRELLGDYESEEEK